jgi:hypothetical protein
MAPTQQLNGSQGVHGQQLRAQQQRETWFY